MYLSFKKFRYNIGDNSKDAYKNSEKIGVRLIHNDLPSALF